MFKILFYYYYLLDKSITNDDPHIWAVLHLGLFEGLIINYPVQQILITYYNIIPPTYVGVTIGFIIILCNYLYFVKSGKCEEIIKEEPKLFGSHWLSVTIALFFALGAFSLYWVF